jgi:chromosome partitioning protein
VFIVNGASPRARITSEAAIALSQHGTVATDFVHHRSDFASSMIDGRTVMELPRATRSSAEIEALWGYVARRIERVAARLELRNGQLCALDERERSR